MMMMMMMMMIRVYDDEDNDYDNTRTVYPLGSSNMASGEIPALKWFKTMGKASRNG